jgi:hypothetical protein
VTIDWYYEMSRLDRILAHLVELMENSQTDDKVFGDLWDLLHERVKFLRLFTPNLGVREYEWGPIDSDLRRAFSERDAFERELGNAKQENSVLRNQLIALLDDKIALTEQIKQLKQEAKDLQQAAHSKASSSEQKPGIDTDFYVVQQGDSLWRISQRTGVPVGTLRELNNIAGSELQIGQKLRLRP